MATATTLMLGAMVLAPAMYSHQRLSARVDKAESRAEQSDSRLEARLNGRIDQAESRASAADSRLEDRLGARIKLDQNLTDIRLTHLQQRLDAHESDIERVEKRFDRVLERLEDRINKR